MLGLLAQNLRRQVPELRPETFFGLFALRTRGFALLGVPLPQGGDLGFGCGAQRGQFGFGARALFGQRPHLFLAAPEGFLFGRGGLFGGGQPGFGGREAGRGVAFARLGIGEPARLPAPQEQDEDEYGGQTAGRQQEKQGKGHGCSVVFDCKNSNLFPESEFLGPCVILFAPDGISCAEFYNFVSY